jgi:hypothetical protein
VLPDPAEVFVDDANVVGDEERVLRVVNPIWVDWNSQNEQGRPRLTSQAFQDFPEERCIELGVPARSLSVGLEPVLAAHGYSYAKMLDPWGESYGLVAITGGSVRGCKQGIRPWATEREPWHGLIFTLLGNKRAVGKQKCLGREAEWLIVPPH